VPALLQLCFACDQTAAGYFTLDREGRRSLTGGSPAVTDRELAHYVVMFNCGVAALVGILVHVRLVAARARSSAASSHGATCSPCSSSGPPLTLASRSRQENTG
jgi:hypothetical protein